MRQPIFIHNPKCASTSIRNTLKDVRSPADRTIHLPVIHPKVKRQIKRAPNPWVFGVVRHPLDRAWSAFHYWKKPRNRSVPEFSVIEAIVEGMTPNEFFMATNMEKVARIVPHFQRQRWFFKGGHRIDQILRFENLAEDFEELCLNLGIVDDPPQLPVLRATPHGSWRDEITPETEEKLRDFYREDFEEYYDGQ